MNNLKKILFYFTMLLCYATNVIAAAAASEDDTYDYSSLPDTSDYDSRITSLETTVASLQKQITNLQTQLQTGKVTTPTSSTGASSYSITNSSSTNPYNQTNSGSTSSLYNSSNYTQNYSPTNYGATSSLYGSSGSSKNTNPAKKISTPQDQIAVLQEKNRVLQADIANHQATINELNGARNYNPKSLAQKKSMNQNAITKNNDQIAANNRQIVTLQTSTVQSRSTLLGRLSSKYSKIKKTINKKIKLKN
jgi:cell division protein FtsB